MSFGVALKQAFSGLTGMQNNACNNAAAQKTQGAMCGNMFAADKVAKKNGKEKALKAVGAKVSSLKLPKMAAKVGKKKGA